MSNAVRTPPLDPADWSRARALFDLALGLPADMREPFVRSADDTDAVRDEVLALLRHSTDAGALPSGLLEPARTALRAPPREGLRLGPWRLDALIGAGGMGDIYRASRADGVYVGTAAVKILKRGMDSVGVLQRFSQEQQALAMLNHPHIASLFDAGLTPDGLPYFVMELIDGQPIDVACQGMPLPTRLEIFLQLADAVAYAHRMLLVHRDLKPGNVLVTPAGQVKLLDFGIAKALDRNDAATDITAGTQRPFTPSHASPEQVRGERVGTATDIYSLGVLLYQLLTGQRPYGRGAISPAEAALAVLEEEPTRPSSLSPVDTDDRTWLVTRAKLKGDLDNILLKALEKPLERRYASVDALAADVRAYLTGHPVSAREASGPYLVGKFVFRNRVVVAASSVALMALIGGISGAVWQAHRAQSRLKDIRSMSNEVVMRYGDAITHLPGGMKLKEKLLKDTVGYLDRLSAEADDDLAFKGEIGMAYARLADIQVSNFIDSLDNDAAGERNAARALTLLGQAEPAGVADPKFYMFWGRALRSRAMVARSNDRVDDALVLIAQAIPVLERGLRRFPADQDIRSELGSILLLSGQMNDTWIGTASKGRGDVALQFLDRAQAVYEGLARDDTNGPEAYTYPFQLGTIEGARALVMSKRQLPEQAVEHSRAELRYQQQALGMAPENATIRGGVSTSANNLAAMCLDLDNGACALQAARLAWNTLGRLESDDPSNEAWRAARRNLSLHLGRALLATDDAADSLAPLEMSESALRPSVEGGKGTPAQIRRLAWTLLAQAGAHQRLAHDSEAASRASEARDLLTFLVRQAPDDDSSWRLLGELCAERATVLSQRNAAWLAEGRHAYAKAAALRPLVAHHLSLSKRLERMAAAA